jgi:CopG family transcriptional regulator/antitoxin EndoAI
MQTVKVLDRLAPKGDRSRLIDTAIRYYVTNRAKSNLAKRVQEGARANAQRDLELAEDWFTLED